MQIKIFYIIVIILVVGIIFFTGFTAGFAKSNVICLTETKKHQENHLKVLEAERRKYVEQLQKENKKVQLLEETLKNKPTKTEYITNERVVNIVKESECDNFGTEFVRLFRELHTFTISPHS